MGKRTAFHRYAHLHGEDCVYCGDVATVRDHVLPISYANGHTLTDAERGLLFTVPACGSCNGILGARVFDSLGARAGYIADHLERKHRKLLGGAEWSAEELAALGPTLRGRLAARQDARKKVAARIASARLIAADTESSAPDTQIA